MGILPKLFNFLLFQTWITLAVMRICQGEGRSRSCWKMTERLGMTGAAAAAQYDKWKNRCGEMKCNGERWTRWPTSHENQKHHLRRWWGAEAKWTFRCLMTLAEGRLMFGPAGFCNRVLNNTGRKRCRSEATSTRASAHVKAVVFTRPP